MSWWQCGSGSRGRGRSTGRGWAGAAAAAAAALVVGVGCQAKKAEGPKRPTFVDELRVRPQAFVAEVARSRGLSAKAPVEIVLDDDRAFRLALEEAAKSSSMKPSAALSNAFYLAFNFPLAEPGAASKKKAAQDEALVDEQLLGFFDEGTAKVHVRRTKLERMSSQDEARLLLAHEVGHALQHQHFGKLFGEFPTDDALLSKKALIEGDASVAGVAYLASWRRKPARRLLARASAFMREGAGASLSADDPSSRALRAAPANERARLLFPYWAGFAFASDVYRVGGFSLLDKVFSRPPESTEQVLHPDKYLAGEGPVPVKAPEPPAGFQRVAGGRLGELMTGVALEQCSPGEGARLAAEGWGGDAWAVVEKGESIALLWSTVWDDDASAERFAQAVRGKASCWGAERRWAGHLLPSGITVERDGRKVAVVRGLGAPMLAQQAKALLSLPGQPLASTAPFGPLRTVPVKPPAAGDRGRMVDDDTYRSELLGVTAPLPDGYSVKLGDKGLTLTITREKAPMAISTLTLSDEPPTPESNEEAFAELIKSMREAMPGAAARPAESGAMSLPLGRAQARSWVMTPNGVKVRGVVLPICNGTGSLVLVQAWRDERGERELDGFLRSLSWTGGAEPPICNDLDP